jgi:hypothetical protein
MAAQQKGNPAAHRMSNVNRAARRARSYLRGLKRREENQRQNKLRASANQRRREIGEKTPWELAKEARFHSNDRVAKRDRYRIQLSKQKRQGQGAS